MSRKIGLLSTPRPPISLIGFMSQAERRVLRTIVLHAVKDGMPETSNGDTVIG
jgi:hypothetical protein